jgi:hypothetical protein
LEDVLGRSLARKITLEPIHDSMLKRAEWMRRDCVCRAGNPFGA